MEGEYSCLSHEELESIKTACPRVMFLYGRRDQKNISCSREPCFVLRLHVHDGTEDEFDESPKESITRIARISSENRKCRARDGQCNRLDGGVDVNSNCQSQSRATENELARLSHNIETISIRGGLFEQRAFEEGAFQQFCQVSKAFQSIYVNIEWYGCI